MKDDSSSAFAFRPEAMLPAWLVTDQSLIVRHWNDFTNELLEIFGVASLLAEHRLSVDLSPFRDKQVRSLWEGILDPEDLSYVKEALRVLKEHQRVLDRFNETSNPRPAAPLIDELRRVKGSAGITPYVYHPGKMGVRVSPVQGLKLIMKSMDNPEVQDSPMEYVDILIAYRLKVDPDAKGLKNVFFEGVQPAIHDASARHRLWQSGENAKRAQITTFLSHAFQTPISNIKSMAGELRKAPLTDYYLKRFEKLTAHIDDLGHLSELIVFITASDKIPAIVCKSVPEGMNVWERVTVAEIREEVLKTLQSVMSGRTRARRNERKIELLNGMNGTSEATALIQSQPATDFARAADAILELRGVDSTDSFGLLLPAENSWDVARRVKTTFLNLLLVELLLNAIKSADEQSPKVKLVVEVNENKDRLDVSIINNGLALKETEFNNIDELAEKPGEKRKALGHKLNKIAAEKLDWNLEWKEPHESGTHLTLSIPYQD